MKLSGILILLVIFYLLSDSVDGTRSHRRACKRKGGVLKWKLVRKCKHVTQSVCVTSHQATTIAATTEAATEDATAETTTQVRNALHKSKIMYTTMMIVIAAANDRFWEGIQYSSRL